MPYPWSSLHHEARLHDLRVIIHGTTDCWTRFRALSDAVKVSPSGRRISASQSNKRLLPRAGSTSRSAITALETICTAIPSSGGLDRHMIRRSSCSHCQHTSEHRCRGSCAPAHSEGFVVGVVVSGVWRCSFEHSSGESLRPDVVSMQSSRRLFLIGDRVGVISSTSCCRKGVEVFVNHAVEVI